MSMVRCAPTGYGGIADVASDTNRDLCASSSRSNSSPSSSSFPSLVLLLLAPTCPFILPAVPLFPLLRFRRHAASAVLRAKASVTTVSRASGDGTTPLPTYERRRVSSSLHLARHASSISSRNVACSRASVTSCSARSHRYHCPATSSSSCDRSPRHPTPAVGNSCSSMQHDRHSQHPYSPGTTSASHSTAIWFASPSASATSVRCTLCGTSSSGNVTPPSCRASSQPAALPRPSAPLPAPIAEAATAPARPGTTARLSSTFSLRVEPSPCPPPASVPRPPYPTPNPTPALSDPSAPPSLSFPPPTPPPRPLPLLHLVSLRIPPLLSFPPFILVGWPLFFYSFPVSNLFDTPPPPPPP
eukprot:Sspe_Gene.10627::Locus_3557_Transcript_1_1_Confidence_1.000_Length_1158::g.10627::m.10627